MAQDKKKRPRTGSGPATRNEPPAGAKQPPRSAVGFGPQGSAIRRQSVAANRGKGETNKTQLYIFGAAVLIIAAVVIAGMVLNKSNAVQIKNDGYGPSKSGIVAMATDGAMTIAAASTANGSAALNIDVYEDPLCPFCGNFERDFGQQIAKAVDEGKLTVNYHLLNFLDTSSGSGNYSSRAVATLMCTATHLGSTKGTWASLHAALYSTGLQPQEGSAGLSNEQLNAQISSAAAATGVPAGAADLVAAMSCVTNGEMLPTVITSYNTSAATLNSLVGGVKSPVIVSSGAVVNVNDSEWLTNLLAAG